KDKVQPCFEDAFKQNFEKFHQIAILATRVQDHCEDAQTRGCLVLPVPFKNPYKPLSKSKFRILYRDKDEKDSPIFGRSQGRCAKYVDTSGSIDKAITVELEEEDIPKTESADWTKSRVEVVWLDQDPPNECSIWKTPLSKRIPPPPRSPDSSTTQP